MILAGAIPARLVPATPQSPPPTQQSLPPETAPTFNQPKTLPSSRPAPTTLPQQSAEPSNQPVSTPRSQPTTSGPAITPPNPSNPTPTDTQVPITEHPLIKQTIELFGARVISVQNRMKKPE